MNAVVLAILAAAAPVDFDTDVLPVLTRAGCNAGACHGAAAGRGGFKLSLFGGDPAGDYRAIVSDLEGRRVNLARPDRSLLLLKPTWELDHEGGQRFEADSPQAKLLLEWMRTGAQRLQSRKLAILSVEPTQVTVDSLPAVVQLKVTARFAEGPSRRVEDAAVFTPADPTATEIDTSGRVKVLRPGRHAIIVRYLTHVEAVQITAPHSHPSLDLADQPRGNWIDGEIYAALLALRLPPSPQADDATLLRRVTLDLTGRLPTPDRVREFLFDQSQDKFAAEVERLLASPEFAEYWTYKFARWLRIRTGPNDVRGTQAFHGWLRKQIESNRPLDEWTAELITAEGDSHVIGSANFHRTIADARAEAEYVTESLLGIRLRCANCHNHPLDRWTQDDYHGLAAIFARVDRGQVVKLRSSGEIVHPGTGEAAVARIPGEQFLAVHGDHRPALAQWLISSEHRRFAKAQVNRLWQSMFGRGLIEPIDDLRDTNPASHPQLLDRLADELIAHRYDLRHTLRLLANSAAYQRSSRPLPTAKSDDRFYSHALTRPLAPEVLLDLVCDATGLPNDYRVLPFNPNGTAHESSLIARRATALFDVAYAFTELGPLADREGNGGCAREVDGAGCLDDLTVQLYWINGPLVNSRLSNDANWFAAEAQSSATSSALAEAYYLRTVSRLPTEDERKFWQAALDGEDRSERLRDFAWGLLSSREFVTNH